MTALTFAHRKKLLQSRKRPVVRHIGQLPASLIADLLTYWQNQSERNDLSEAITSRKERQLPIQGIETIDRDYAQLYLLKAQNHGATSQIKETISSVENILTRRVGEITGPLSQMRISTLESGAKIPMHIDDPEQCRVVSLLQGAQEFVLENKAGRHKVEMMPGDLYFVNTAWPHSVLNTSVVERVALLLDLIETSPFSTANQQDD